MFPQWTNSKPGFDLDKYEFSYPLHEMKFAAKTFKMCWWGCHEAAQVNQPGTILPRIEGQAVDYFLKQWNAFDGDREGSIASQMKLMMHSYTPDQIARGGRGRADLRDPLRAQPRRARERGL